MAGTAQTFRQAWRAGRKVQEKATPHRTGTIRTVQGTGFNARVFVNFPGRPPASFRPAQLTLL